MSGLSFCLSGVDFLAECGHGLEEFMLDRFGVGIPMTRLDVLADCLKQVGLVVRDSAAQQRGTRF